MSSRIALRYNFVLALLVGIPFLQVGLPATGMALGAEIVLESVKPPQSDSKFGLTNSEYQAISQMLRGARHVVPVRTLRQTARRRTRELEVQLVGTTAEYAEVDQLDVAQGRFLTSQDGNKRNNVAVLGAVAARRLFGIDMPIGQHVRVGGQYFLVVGMLEPTQTTSRRQDGRSIYIPLSTMQSRYGDRQVKTLPGMFERYHYELSQIRIVLEEPESIEPTMEVLRSLFKKTHEQQDYSIRRVDESTVPVPN